MIPITSRRGTQDGCDRLNIRSDGGLRRASILIAEFIDTAHRLYTASLSVPRLAGELCDKFADSTVQLGVCAKAENFALR